MATASLVQSTSAVKANTSAEANTVVMRDNQGGVTNNVETVTGLVNAGYETWPHTAIKTTGYSVGASDRVVYYDTTGGAFAITLPLSSALDGRILTLVNATNSTTALTITPSGADTCTNATLTAANGYATYQSDGVSAWTRIG